MKKLLLIFGLLLCAIPASANLSVANLSAPITGSGASPQTITGITSTTGNLAVAQLVLPYGNVVTGCTDNKSQTYVVSSPAPTTSSTTQAIYLCYKTSSTTGVTSVTVTYTGSSGSISASFLDISSATGGTLSGYTATNLTTGANPSVAISAAGQGISIAVVSGDLSFGTVASPWTTSSLSSGPISEYTAGGYYVHSSSGTQTASWTTASQTWNGVIAEFEETSGASGGGGFGGKAGIGGTAGIG